MQTLNPKIATIVQEIVQEPIANAKVTNKDNSSSEGFCNYKKQPVLSCSKHF